MSSKGVAIVTGCAANGIGRAIALRLASDGYDVALNDLPSQRAQLESLAKDIKGQFSRRTLIITGDVSEEATVKNFVDETVKVLGGLDVMVANAALCPVKSLLDATAADFDKVIGVNLRGVFLCFQNAARVMIAQGKGGRIIGASSAAGKQGVPLLPAYSASKAGIRALTQSAAAELGRFGITVNSYAPGVIDTDLAKASSVDLKAATTFTFGDMAVKTTNLARMGKPEEIAGLVSWIASKESSYMTGQTISVNGGSYYD